MTVFLDTNVLVRHLIQEPPEMGRRATAFLSGADALHLTDLILAETVYVLRSVYRVPRPQVAALARAVIGSRGIVTDDPATLIRAVDIYEHDRLSFADAYLIARAEAAEPHSAVASFDKGLDKVGTVRRIEPGRLDATG
ncbi:PIN domain-containing protein [Nocardia puris]|uniref:PIN domain-containing protein n=1 Tax=Nocardia puris TaxID=208602 RepID=UPI00082CD484|nr:PIN domain-containing protein [Nocardia puris]MBF6211444.1 PIN domain-containing protein [Nocardia puris]MBF6365161.1 PIN domain-containing protein [Nocardia puris]MBF6458947.1 PIN domain-containing protein [Nocardia puris]